MIIIYKLAGHRSGLKVIARRTQLVDCNGSEANIHLDHQLRKRFGFSSLRKRIMVLLTIGSVGFAIFMASVSYNAIYTMQHDKIKTSMASICTSRPRSSTR
ncbi:hypothetical protein GZH47_14610 [Paenibacillus rhizovicinus]|uniref:Uncharacterized protein n=1 Tax=Paenibacillus rhizovicinus TaxID=2704463 RepID=A0A6C0P121_9BACL|nr:hypothetical protein [Paenibacillus rhizovicinus]QHW31926.1 hypothetical protein GZH47_14610 [Paenibacillus rhizovicinus]